MTDAPVVSVRGEVIREVDPEIATFAVTAEARDKDRQETMRRLASRVDALRGLLDGYPDAIEKRETAGLFVVPEGKGSGGKGSGEKVKAYRGSVTTTVTVTDFGVLGELMLRLADQDQTMVAGPWWAVRPASPVHREARRAAITDAITRAREYAEALGARVIRLTELSDAGMSTHSLARPGGMVPLAYRAAPGGELPQLDLEPQRQQVSAAIEARFQISDPTALYDPVD